MRFWRWHNLPLLAGLSLVALGGSQPLYAAAPATPDPTVNVVGDDVQQSIQAYVAYYSAKMASAPDSKHMFRDRQIVDALVHQKNHPASAIFMDNYGAAVSQAFQPLLMNPKTALNAIITIATIKDISTQSALNSGLTSSNAAVRYWSARGLDQILPQLEAIPPAFHQSIRKLEAALKTEKDPIVQMSMCQALVNVAPAVQNAPSLLIGVLIKIADIYKIQTPNTLAATYQIVRDLGHMVARGGPLVPAEEIPALGVLSRIMSFTAQYDQKGLLRRDQKVAAFDLISACGHTMNLISRTQDFSMNQFTRQSDPAAILLHVNHLTGAQNQHGILQTLFAKVSVPPRVGGN